MRRWLYAVLLASGCAAPPVVDAGAPEDAGVVDAGAADAGAPDAGVDAGCVDCTSLTARFEGGQADFTRAQHGVEPGGGLYVEAYFGGDPACPTSTSPTPDRTLIVAGLHALADGGVETEADGLKVSLLDFVGTLSPHPFDKAFAARAQALEVEPGVRVRFALEATFDAGTVRGTFSAAHCTSLDGP